MIPGRGIPARGVAPPSGTPGILGRRALRSGCRAPGLKQRITFPGDQSSEGESVGIRSQRLGRVEGVKGGREPTGPVSGRTGYKMSASRGSLQMIARVFLSLLLTASTVVLALAGAAP